MFPKNKSKSKAKSVNINGVKFFDDEPTETIMDEITEQAIKEIKLGNVDGKVDTRIYPELEFVEALEVEVNPVEQVKCTTNTEEFEARIKKMSTGLVKFNYGELALKAKRVLNKSYRDLSLVTKMDKFTHMEQSVCRHRGIKLHTPEPAPFLPTCYPFVCLIRNVNLRHPELSQDKQLVDLSIILNLAICSDEVTYGDESTVRFVLCQMIDAFVERGIKLHPGILEEASRYWPGDFKRPEWLLNTDEVEQQNPFTL